MTGEGVRRHIVMIASENDALRGGKVGGVGDVLRDLPRALAALGFRVSVIVPSYGFLHRENPSVLAGTVAFPFGGKSDRAEIYQATPLEAAGGVAHLIVHHPSISGEPIYYNDPPDQPFARDAAKYALFSAAAGSYCARIEGEYLLHLHDWHTGILFLLRALHPAFAHLKRAPTSFTIHNLAIQGTRPMTGRGSSVEEWFPELFADRSWIASWKDHRYAVPCFTPMAAGITKADRVNTVSPGYAGEILTPSDHARGFFGGEGLESLLREADRAGRFSGILNGTEYPPAGGDPPLAFGDLCTLLDREIARWSEHRPEALHEAMRRRLESLRSRPPRILLTSVARIVEQKVRLLLERGSGGRAAIEGILGLLDRYDGLYVLQGSGSPEYEALLSAAALRNDRLLFLKGYSQPVARALYGTGNLFLMPSSFEPCGISQMVAMRAHQPCVVHAVGGLKDTVLDGVNGFTFAADSLPGQADQLVAAVERALNIFSCAPSQWEDIRAAAGRARFTWEAAARKYVERVYR